jgi:Na+/H+ antiporter NhaD/arsenite permease-like protein
LAEGHNVPHLGELLPGWSMLPFLALLGAIAILPLAAAHFWESNRNRALVAMLFSAPVAIYLLLAFGQAGGHALAHKLQEYASFILLLAALYVISGGICIRGSIEGTPRVNTAILVLGAVLANFIGTTGASMLLVRPMLRANARRTNQSHVVVFFIFMVSNCGGLLTPLGDPPLFLGFILGVPFLQTALLWKEWALVNGALLVLFFVWDSIDRARERRKAASLPAASVPAAAPPREPIRVAGLRNALLLMGVVATIYGAGQGVGNGGKPWPFGVQELLMGLLAVVSYLGTPREIHKENHFIFGPIVEVAVLFAGIFVTMTPALLILNAMGPKLRVNEPWEYFWITGLLSGFLDNAPTYLTFASAAAGTQGVPVDGRYLGLLLERPLGWPLLAAISCGSVFMGAYTYIGNGPNFMVKAIAEDKRYGVKMPGFFGYMVYSTCILIPLFVLVTFVFFR